MISCRECLTTVSTGGYGEMLPATEVGLHCAICPDCARVVTEVKDRENRIANALAQLRMTSPPAAVAQHAVVSHRRLKAHILRMGLMGALIATISIGIFNRLIPAFERAVPAFGGDMVTATIPLNCITQQQATDLATPFLRSNKPGVYTARDIQAVTLRGVRRELMQAKAEILAYDVKCRLPRATTLSSEELGRQLERQRMLDALAAQKAAEAERARRLLPSKSKD